MKTAVIGSFVVDLMARAPHLPEPGETVKGSFFQAGPGGKGANQAVAAKRAGCDLVFSTKLGTDDFSKIALDSFRNDGISEEYIFRTETAPTGAALISVDEKTSQNEIIVVLGACNTFTDEDIAKLDKALDGCEYLLMQLEINPDAVEKIVELAWRKNIRIILNTAPVQEIPDHVYQKLYLVTPNEVEAHILTGISCDDEAGCEKAARVFLDKGVKNVIITLGKRGVYGFDGTHAFTIGNFDVPVLDTTGAGDAFNGGLLAGLGQGLPLERAAKFANVVSNLAVTKLGTAPAMPGYEEIQAFIQKENLTI